MKVEPVGRDLRGHPDARQDDAGDRPDRPEIDPGRGVPPGSREPVERWAFDRRPPRDRARRRWSPGQRGAGRVLACSPSTLLLVLIVTEPPGQNSSLPIILVLLAAHSDVAALRDAKVVGAERGELTTGVHDGMSMARPITCVADEAAAVDRAHDRLLDVDRPPLVFRKCFEGWQPFGFGDASRPLPVPATGALHRLKRLNASLNH